MRFDRKKLRFTRTRIVSVKNVSVPYIDVTVGQNILCTTFCNNGSTGVTVCKIIIGPIHVSTFITTYPGPIQSNYSFDLIYLFILSESKNTLRDQLQKLKRVYKYYTKMKSKKPQVEICCVATSRVIHIGYVRRTFRVIVQENNRSSRSRKLFGTSQHKNVVY